MKYDIAISLLVTSFSIGLNRGLYLVNTNIPLYDILGQANECVFLIIICLVVYKRHFEFLVGTCIYLVMSINEFRQIVALKNFEITVSDWTIISLSVCGYGIFVYLFRKTKGLWTGFTKL